MSFLSGKLAHYGSPSQRTICLIDASLASVLARKAIGNSPAALGRLTMRRRQSFVADYDEGVRLRFTNGFDSEAKEPPVPIRALGCHTQDFHYSGLQGQTERRKTVTFTIENTGGLAGTEELRKSMSNSLRPSKEHFRRLAAWQRVPLNSGQRKVVTVALEPPGPMATFKRAERCVGVGIRAEYTGYSSAGLRRDLPLRASGRFLIEL